MNRETILRASKLYKNPEGYSPSYGTAGFRDNASLLAATVFRCGLLAACRSIITGQACGIMITASHNPIQDNGVKLIEPDGGMLPQSCEAQATLLAQSIEDEHVFALVEDITREACSIGSAGEAKVFIGHDTRPSAPSLLSAAQAGVEAVLGPGGIINYGLVTTPQLHYAVYCHNQGIDSSLGGYFKTLVDAYEGLVQDLPHSEPRILHIDCANGVGAIQLQSVSCLLEQSEMRLKLILHNNASDEVERGALNDRCGSDFVQKERIMPSDFDQSGFSGEDEEVRCCSIDGDADRLVFFYPKKKGSQVLLLDGDKIATLVAIFISEALAQLPPSISKGLTVGVVQTAYANGASTSYIQTKLGIETRCTPTGVKHLHQVAHSFDIGIYFEANGHGTVLFSQSLLDKLHQSLREDEVKEADGKAHAAIKDLLLLSKVINQTVGDAISGILMVEAILARKGWTMADWDALYTDLPSRQTKLKVKDRSAITTTDQERRCVTPHGLQDAIDAIVSEFNAASGSHTSFRSNPSFRAFVRPSGTEDAVRVYAEGMTQEMADELAARVGRVVFDSAGGVGARP